MFFLFLPSLHLLPPSQVNTISLPTQQIRRRSRVTVAKLAHLSRSVDNVVAVTGWMMMLGAVQLANGFGGKGSVDTRR